MGPSASSWSSVRPVRRPPGTATTTDTSCGGTATGSCLTPARGRSARCCWRAWRPPPSGGSASRTSTATTAWGCPASCSACRSTRSPIRSRSATPRAGSPSSNGCSTPRSSRRVPRSSCAPSTSPARCWPRRGTRCRRAAWTTSPRPSAGDSKSPAPAPSCGIASRTWRCADPTSVGCSATGSSLGPADPP